MIYIHMYMYRLYARMHIYTHARAAIAALIEARGCNFPVQDASFPYAFPGADEYAVH